MTKRKNRLGAAFVIKRNGRRIGGVIIGQGGDGKFAAWSNTAKIGEFNTAREAKSAVIRRTSSRLERSGGRGEPAPRRHSIGRGPCRSEA